MTYIVVENAGYDGETDVYTAKHFHTAFEWMENNYSLAERCSLHVDIAVERNGERSYEI